MIGPPDVPGVYFYAGDKCRRVCWKASTVAVEFEERAMRQASELTELSSKPLNLMITVMLEGTDSEAMVSCLQGRFVELGYRGTQSDPTRMMFLPHPIEGWRKLRKAYPPTSKKRRRKR